jgi:cell division protein FtsW
LLLLTVIGLTLFGIIMVASASAVIAERFGENPQFFARHQVVYGGGVGLAVFLLGFFVPYRLWRRVALPGLLLSLALLVLVFVPGLQVSSGGAVRWIGFGPFTVQPTEITKLAFIIYLAALLEKKGSDIQDFRKSVVPFVVTVGLISVLIILQPDIGTLLSITAIALTMVYAAGFRLVHLMIIVLGGAGLFAVLLNTARYRLERIMVYLHPELDPQGIGYQINQALLAVGTGGLWGLGLGRSRQKYYYLPEPAGDSIFAIIAEELGFVRSMVVLLAFSIIAWRGFAIARRAPDTFGRLLAVGITAWITIQMFINVGSILGILPLTGITLPFISYGGSSLATVLFATGMLLNISKYTQ